MSTANDNSGYAAVPGDPVLLDTVVIDPVSTAGGGGYLPTVIDDPDDPLVDDPDDPLVNGPLPYPVGVPSTIGDETLIGDNDTLVFSDNLNPGPNIDLSYNSAGELIDPFDAAFGDYVSASASEIGNRIDVMMHFDADDFII